MKTRKEEIEAIARSYNLLGELMDTYLVNVDDNGHPKASIGEILDLWGRVKKVLNPKTQNRPF